MKLRLREIHKHLAAHADVGIQLYEGSRVVFRAYSSVATDVKRIADQLRAGGVVSGMCVGILAHNSYEWIVYDLALLEVGAICVALPMEHFADKDRDEVADKFGLRLLFVSADVKDLRPGGWIIRLDLGNVPSFVLRGLTPASPTFNEDVLTLAFSSGTSGQVKCLVMSYEGTEAQIDAFGRDFQFRSSDRILAFLPLSSLQQRWMLLGAIAFGFGFCLATASRLFRALRDFQPTIVCAAPLLFETVEGEYVIKKGVGKTVLEGVRRAAAVMPLWLRTGLGGKVFRPIHSAFGGKVRFCMVGGAPSRTSTLRFYESIGMPLYNAWGVTEAGFQTWNVPGRNRIGSVGKSIYPGALSVAPDGEIIVRHHPMPAQGYFGVDPDEARKTFVAPGIIATGDIGRFDKDGFLFIEGRKKEMIVTRGGYKIQPADLEREILKDDMVASAVVLGGDDLHCVMAVVAVRGQNMAPAVKQRIQQTIEALNKRIPAPSRIERVLFTEERFTRENKLMNRNLKVDRKVVLERFKADLLSMS